MVSSVESLLRICEGYRILGPVFQDFRERHRGHTLIPNALSPIAPGYAYGYGDDCSELLSALEGNPAWRDWRVKIETAYADFRAASGNQVLWAAWNYWDPTRPADKQRMIQVVTGASGEIAAKAQ